MEAKKADIVISLKGRDYGKWFMVIDCDETFLYLANGKQRRVETPKRKKRKHAQYLCTCNHPAAEKLLNEGHITNSEVRKALAVCCEAVDLS